MKTFETEKNNIPEGATGYREQGQYIEWFSGSEGSWRLIGSNVPSITMCDTSSPVRLIPQPKEVEWVNGLPPVGVECEFIGVNCNQSHSVEIYHVDDNKIMFLGNIEKYPEISTITSFKRGRNLMVFYMQDGDNVFRKPESPEEKIERERMESAYDLYFDHMGGDSYHGIADYEFFARENGLHAAWLSTVDKTGYTKKSGE